MESIINKSNFVEIFHTYVYKYINIILIIIIIIILIILKKNEKK